MATKDTDSTHPFEWVSVDDPGDLGALAKFIGDEYDPEHVIDHLESFLSSQTKGILVEQRYVDKDYRSAYYNFYSRKGRSYSPHCIRLHFFGGEVHLVNNFELRSPRPLEQDYLGYMVLRPMMTTPVGRTVLSVAAVENFRAAVISARHHVHVLGYRLEVEGFPYMEQHTDISVCAHAACWSILRHLSQKHRRYAEILIHDVTRLAELRDPGGLKPSRGLEVAKASRVLAEAGLFPDEYSKASFDDGQFYRLLFSYVDSGLPVFVALENILQEAHAFVAIGYGPPDPDAFKDADPKEPLFVWDGDRKLIVMDDNSIPYTTVSFLEATSNGYTLRDVFAFVVPLPEKVYYPAENVEALATKLIAEGKVADLDFSFLKRPVFRYFLTTAPRFKAHVRDKITAFPPNFAQALLELATPQFIWVVEVADLTSFEKKCFNIMMIIDATAGSLEKDPYFVVNDQSKALIVDRAMDCEAGYLDFDRPVTDLPQFQGNLTYRY